MYLVGIAKAAGLNHRFGVGFDERAVSHHIRTLAADTRVGLIGRNHRCERETGARAEYARDFPSAEKLVYEPVGIAAETSGPCRRAIRRRELMVRFLGES